MKNKLEKKVRNLSQRTVSQPIKTNYRKIPPKKPRHLYFSKALFEGFIFGGAYLRREICVSKSIGLACSGKEIYHFCFVLLCILRANSKYKPPGGLIFGGAI